MTESTRSRYRVAIVVVAPAALLAAMFSHPYIPGRLPNNAAIADAVAGGTTRWGLVHLAAAGASGLVILAFVAIRSYLREAGEERWSAIGLPFIIIGGTLFAVLPGMEFAVLAAVEVGTDPQAAQTALQPWFIPVLMGGSLTFALGALAFAKAIADRPVLSSTLNRVVIAAFFLLAASRLVPFFASQFYVQGIVALIAFLPLAYRMWSQASDVRPRPGARADDTDAVQV